MNKTILALTAVFIVTVTTLYFAIPRTSGLRIAILLPAVHPAMDEIERGFKETLSQGTQKYAITTFNASGNKTLLRAQAEEIAHGNYDLVFTVGTLCSHIMHTLKTQKQVSTPLIFCAIDDPTSIGVTAESRAAGDQTTGVYITDDFDAQFAYLKKVKPNTQRVLFVYDPTHGSGMEHVVERLKESAERAHLQLDNAEVFASNELTQKVESLLSAVDTVLIYTDHAIVSGVDSLIKLCNQYQVTLYASDLNSGEKGAALAFGVQEYDHGKEAGLKALTILDDYQLANSIAITPVSDFKLLINKSTMNLQGLNINKHELETLAQDPHILVKERS